MPEAGIETDATVRSIAAKGPRNTHISRVRTNLTQLTPAYEFDARIAWELRRGSDLVPATLVP